MPAGSVARKKKMKARRAYGYGATNKAGDNQAAPKGMRAYAQARRMR